MSAGTTQPGNASPLLHAGGDYRPRPAPLFDPDRIVLAKGSLTTPRRRSLAEGICAAYSRAEVVGAADLPHNRIDLACHDVLELHRRGKRTLVLGEHRSAVRFSAERGNTCPNYWHFAPYGYCPYGCKYCYLAGTTGVRFSPTVKVFLNLPEILGEIGRVACRIRRPTAFYHGKLQDGLALDRLTGYSRVMIPFFAEHRHARLILLTKAAEVDNLLDLDHGGHTILSWSLNPSKICAEFEENTPSPGERMAAMRRCAAAGYGIRAVIMPIIPAAGWQDLYSVFLAELLAKVPIERITLGGVCSYPAARRLMEAKIGAGNTISRLLGGRRCPDGRSRYDAARRIEIHGHLISQVRRLRPDLTIGLCLEERPVFEALNLTAGIGRCNCVI